MESQKKSYGEIESRVDELFDGIKKGIQEYPEYAMLIANNKYNAASQEAKRAGTVFGYDTDDYSLANANTRDQWNALDTVKAIVSGEDISRDQIKNLVHSDAGLEIAYQVANDDFTQAAHDKYVEAQNKTLLSEIQQYVSEMPEAALATADKEVNIAERIFGEASSQAFLARTTKTAIDHLAKGYMPSPADIDILLKSTSFVDILYNNQTLQSEKALKAIESQAERFLIEGVTPGKNAAIADIRSYNQIQHPDLKRFAAVQIAENCTQSPEYQATFTANARGALDEITRLNKENAVMVDEKEKRKAAEFEQQPSTPAQEPSHAKLFELAEVPDKELMDARIHFGTRVAEYTARTNGGPYKGEILATDTHLVQLVSGKSVVFHRKSDVTLPDSLKNLNGHELSIYYKDTTAKAYPLDPVKDQLDRSVASLDRAARAIGLPESFGEQLGQARNEAWNTILANRNPAQEPKQPATTQNEPQRSRSR